MAGRTIPQGPGAEALPPPGDARRDTLKQRTDDLQKQADELAAEMQVHVGRPVSIDNEIAAYVNYLDPPHKDPTMQYCWAFCDPYGKVGNQPVMRKKAEGWEPVRASDPDAVGLEHAKHVTGNIIVGDAILMRIP